jgi:hypothetical protein
MENMEGGTFQIFASIPQLYTPRPNGSRALVQAVDAVQAWLEGEGIAVQIHSFILYPYHMELLGTWLALTGLLLPIAALGHWGWAGLLLALLTVAVPLAEVRFQLPTVTALIRQPARNLVIQLPVPQARCEVILCAHLDSKTEPLDHRQREILLRLSLPAMGLALACGVLLGLETVLPVGTARLACRWLALGLSLPVAADGLAMAVNLIAGRFSRHPSTGAVDNGAAVAVQLALARHLHRGHLRLERTAVSLLFTVGEEAQMQGARAYVRDREKWPVPVCAINLEILGQNGGYLLWLKDGTALYPLSADLELLDTLDGVLRTVTGTGAIRSLSANTDALAFLRAGIPAATLGSFDLDLGERGFHCRLDQPGRIDPDRLEQVLEVLVRFLTDLDDYQQLRSRE